MRLSFAVWLIAVSQNIFAVAGDVATSSSCRNLDSLQATPPYVAPRILKNGAVVMIDEDDKSVATQAVTGCCTASISPSTTQGSCKADLTDSALKRQVIGKMPQFTQDQAVQALNDAQEAWKGGSGVWPQMSWRERVAAIQNLITELQKARSEIIETLMWEIGKNYPDAASEFDRTMSFIQQVIQVIQTELDFGGASWQAQGSSAASSLFTFVRRAALGIVLVLGPYNYPLNETYATLIPALLMGNVCILKIPTVGGLVHLLTLQAFAKALPPGTINYVSGSGRATLPPILKSGAIDALAFVGGSHAADQLIQQHPHPHRLKLFLQLEAKNMGIFLPDLFENSETTSSEIPKNSYLDVALDEALLGALSFNGQRCTALKLLLVPRQHGERFGQALAQRLQEQWTVGLPWQLLDDSSSYPKLTPLPNHDRVEYMQRLIQDAVSKGATILNAQGGTVVGQPKASDDSDAAASSSTLMIPAILYPVTPDMDVYHQEQFGPIVPIVPYDDLETVLDLARNGPYGQQVSVFTSSLAANAAPSQAVADVTKLLDRFATIFGKINLNQQCGRSPDTLPFSGRRSSALGVMSVEHVLEEFSVPVVVAYKDHHSLSDGGNTNDFSDKLQATSKFLE